ncbi:LysR family transcriptional regulator [Intestinibacter sp.]|uniref:LysR family transcriptional regulator n=1 Tax=Intestinibacter sp. TaxID=1965304 RepID=UPI003F156BE6
MYNQLLNTFLIVADCKSFNKAAEKLYITPASVMKQINSLETHLSLKLFTRNKQGTQLTDAGKSIYKDAKKIIKESERAIERAKQVQISASKTLKIGSSFLNPCNFFLDLWNKKSKNPSEYKFKIIPYSDDHNQILSVVESLGKYIDFLVGALNSIQMHNLANYFELGEYDLCVAMSKDNPLAVKDILEISDLYDKHLIMPKSDDTVSLNKFRKSLKISHPEIIFDEGNCFYDIETFNKCEESDNMLLTLDAWKNIHPSLVTLPVNWNFKVPYGLLYAKNPSDDVLHFLDLLRELI